MKKVFVLLSLIMIVAGVGCTILSQQVTPAEVDQDALRYAIDAGIAELQDYNAWYPNMAEAARLKKDVDAAHNIIRLDLAQMMQKDTLIYSIHKGVVANNLVVAEQREEMLFGETGLLSLGMSMLGAGGFAGFLGLMRRKPGDISPQVLEQTLATATGKTTEELSAKQKHLIQVVKGVQVFLDTYKNTSDNKEAVMIKELKVACNATQDFDTKIAVSAAKINS